MNNIKREASNPYRAFSNRSKVNKQIHKRLDELGSNVTAPVEILSVCRCCQKEQIAVANVVTNVIKEKPILENICENEKQIYLIFFK